MELSTALLYTCALSVLCLWVSGADVYHWSLCHLSHRAVFYALGAAWPWLGYIIKFILLPREFINPKEYLRWQAHPTFDKWVQLMEKFMFGGSGGMDLYLVWIIFDSCLLAVLINIFYMVDRVGCGEALHTYEEIWISVARFWYQESSLNMIVRCFVFKIWNF